MLGILRAGGVDDQSAAWGCDVLPLIATATAIETVTYQERRDGPEAEIVAGLRATFSGLPPDRFPPRCAIPLAVDFGDYRQGLLDRLAVASARFNG